MLDIKNIIICEASGVNAICFIPTVKHPTQALPTDNLQTNFGYFTLDDTML